MEAIYSSETSVATQRTTRHHIPEDDTLHNHRCENLKSYMHLFQFSGEGETPTLLGPLERANLNHWTMSKNPVIPRVIHHRQKPLETFRPTILVRNSDYKPLLGRRVFGWQGTIEMGCKEVGLGDVDWVHLAQDRTRRGPV
jgi:hypothetical protein